MHLYICLFVSFFLFRLKAFCEHRELVTFSLTSYLLSITNLVFYLHKILQRLFILTFNFSVTFLRPGPLKVLYEI